MLKSFCHFHRKHFVVKKAPCCADGSTAVTHREFNSRKTELPEAVTSRFLTDLIRVV